MSDLLFSLPVPCHCLRFTLLYSISSSLPVFFIAGVAVDVFILLIFGLLASNFLVAFCSRRLLGSWLGADLLCSTVVHHRCWSWLEILSVQLTISMTNLFYFDMLKYIHEIIEETGGEDAHFICSQEHAIGVADGVGGWADSGVNVGFYSRELMSHSVDAIQEEPKGSIDPARVLEKAHSITKAMGSSTACIIALTDQVLMLLIWEIAGLW
ncbi:hypothetical protein HN51_067210 [Arachis hypogaea]